MPEIPSPSSPEDAIKAIESEFHDRPDHGSSSSHDYVQHVEEALNLLKPNQAAEMDWPKGDIDRIDAQMIAWYEDCISRSASGEVLTYEESDVMKKILHALRDDEVPINCSPANFRSLFGAYLKMIESPRNEAMINDLVVLSNLNHFPRSVLKSLYDDEAGLTERPLHNILSQVNIKSKMVRRAATMVANKCYDGQLLIESIKKQKDMSAVDHILDSYEHPALAALDIIPSSDWPTDKKDAQIRVAVEATNDVLCFLALPDSMSESYVSALSNRLRSDEDDYLKLDELRHELKRCIKNVQHIGEAWTQRLHDELYVDNLWMYSPEELDIMRDLLDKDAETIKYLQSGDVTVVFVDSHGDYNGALMSEGRLMNAFRQPDNRTLTFEMSRDPASVYRILKLLNIKCGVYPSRLVFGAHGLPGSVAVGDASNPVTFYAGEDMQGFDKVELGADSISLRATQIGRMIDECTQPSRFQTGDEAGKVSVVLVSCYGAASRPGSYMSTAKEIASQMSPGNRVYAASTATNISSRRVGNAKEPFFMQLESDENIKSANKGNPINATEQIEATDTIIDSRVRKNQRFIRPRRLVRKSHVGSIPLPSNPGVKYD